MFNSTILDVAISLVFVFLLFSLLCSAIKELIAGIFNLRGKMLAKGINSLLSGLSSHYNLPLPLPKADIGSEEFAAALGAVSGAQPVAKRVMESTVVTSQTSKGVFGGIRMPSYLSDADFSAALLHTLFGTQAIGATSLTSVKTFFESSTLSDATKAPLLAFLSQIDRGKDTLQENIAKWYNDGMDRVSGWYKRQAQWILLGISLVVVLVFGLDSIDLMKRIYHDEPLRNAIVASSAKSVPGDSVAYEQYQAVSSRIDELKLPIGWPVPVDLASSSFWNVVLEKLPGLLITALALSFGAPFWFDVLNKIMNLRLSGNKPEKSTASS